MGRLPRRGRPGEGHQREDLELGAHRAERDPARRQGDRRADSNKIARAAGAQRARIAGSEEVRDATGFDPGGVCPFPLPRVQAVFVERTLLSQPVLWVGAGSDRHMAAVSPTELLRLSRGRPMDVVEQAAYHPS